MKNSRTRKKYQQITIANMKRKITDGCMESGKTNKLLKKIKSSKTKQEYQSADVFTLQHAVFASNAPDRHNLIKALRDHWEVDSGFSSEASPPASGRSSPCLSSCPTTVVAMDCEMVGTGPGGRCSELARCSILDYHGYVLCDKYVRPCQPVTDFRTQWSGIQRHHLHNATPFAQAREEVRPASL